MASIDFAASSRVAITLTDGALVTLVGTVVGDKHWIQVTSTKDTALTTKAAGRAFEIAGYRYDGIFRPVDQLLVPKEPPPTKAPPHSPKAAGSPAAPSGKP